MRDDKRENQEVLDHLKAENDYSQALTKHLEGLRQTLYDEMLSSIQETDYTVPRPRGNYYYYTRTFQGKSYNTFCRAPRSSSNKDDALNIEWDGTAKSPILQGEEVTLDVNQLAEGKDYCAVGRVAHSPSEKLVAYTVDYKGDEQCELHVKSLDTGETIDHDPSLKIYGDITWGKDDSTIFYLKLDDSLRPYQVYRRYIGQDNKIEDELLYEEKDEKYWTSIEKSLDERYLFVDTASKETSEIWYLDLHDKDATLQCISRRRSKVLYEVESRHGKWWITSNVEETPNMRLFTSPAKANCENQWTLVRDPATGEPLFDGGYDRALDAVTTFNSHVVAEGREGGIPRVWILSMDDKDSYSVKVSKFEQLSFPEAAHDVGLAGHYEFDVDNIAVSYDSLITPDQTMEIKLSDTSDRRVIKEKTVPGYNKESYDCDRLMVLARNGETKIPVNLVYRKDVMKRHLSEGKPVHLHLYGYGSYGACIEANFRATRLCLLDRGVVFAIAQIRG